jgi:hypothetical protein
VWSDEAVYVEAGVEQDAERDVADGVGVARRDVAEVSEVSEEEENREKGGGAGS